MWSKIFFGILQRSALGPLFFNYYINNLFYMTGLTDVCNFEDDTSFHPCDSSLEDLVNRLEHDANLATKWFDCNYMKQNENEKEKVSQI